MKPININLIYLNLYVTINTLILESLHMNLIQDEFYT